MCISDEYSTGASCLKSLLYDRKLRVLLVEGQSSVGCRGPEGRSTGGVVPLSAGGAAHTRRGGGEAD